MKCDYCNMDATFFYRLTVLKPEQRKACALHATPWLYRKYPLTEQEYITLTVEEKINGPRN